MTQIMHIRCNRCSKDIACDDRDPPIEYMQTKISWANCTIGAATYDFCPQCWTEMLILAKVEPVKR